MNYAATESLMMYVAYQSPSNGKVLAILQACGIESCWGAEDREIGMATAFVPGHLRPRLQKCLDLLLNDSKITGTMIRRPTPEELRENYEYLLAIHFPMAS